METPTYCEQERSMCDYSLPDKLEMNGQQYTNFQDIDYFAFISEYINTNGVITSVPDLTKVGSLYQL